MERFLLLDRFHCFDYVAFGTSGSFTYQCKVRYLMEGGKVLRIKYTRLPYLTSYLSTLRYLT